jgi:hypothetical protein
LLERLLFGHEYVGYEEFELMKEKDISMPGRSKSGEVIGTTSDDSYHVWS